MPFPFGQYFGRCHILRRRKYSVKSDGVKGGGGGVGGCFIMSLVFKSLYESFPVKQSVEINMICES